MRLNKKLICGALTIGVVAGSSISAFAQNITYVVQPEDMFWKISSKYGISTVELMKANNATEKTVLYPGQIITIPLGDKTVHTVKSGETYWTISKEYGIDLQKLLYANNANEKSILYVGDKVIIPSASQTSAYKTHTVQKGDTYWTVSQKYNVNFSELLKLNGANDKSYLDIGQVIKIPSATTTSVPSVQPYVTYTDYTVQKGDSSWSVAEKYGIPVNDLMKANNINSSTVLNIGQKLKIPVYHIPVKSTPGAKYGELLDWWTEAQYVIPIGSTFEVVDFYTGKSFLAKRTAGSNHADCETLTVKDTNLMKQIWGGFSWERRPVIIKINGRKVAAGMSAMPHAGNDSAPGGVWTSWRSGDYGAGTNHDYIKGNGIDGHFDIHFYNSTRHKDGKV
ncbi:MAG: LysM peptidoglycan-binding domain-containing protein, partial [Clostridiaceae bacterium]|nr:LysM peptidoglycan-binding domain-containing protein [Clostridiaceae bacterium]